MTILGISCYYHDASACLVVDGRVVAAAAQERFSRIKHDNRFPVDAIMYCLAWAGISAGDIDTVVFYEKPVVKFDRILRQHITAFPGSGKVFVDTIGSWFDQKLHLPKQLTKTIGYKGPVHYIEHHLAHAASAYYLSHFDQSVIVTIDGVGEWATTTMGSGKGTQIRIDREIHFPHSLGLLYSTLTSYLGFTVNDAEYKVMGLAAYGDPKPFRRQVDRLVRIFPDGSYALNLEYFDFIGGSSMFNSRLEALFGYSARLPESPMEPHYANIAAGLQEKLEQVVFSILTIAHKRYRVPNLCLAGGVALNSVLNGKILSHTPFTRLSIPPDPGDGGGAMGAALWFWYEKGNPKLPTEFSPYLGPSFPEEQIVDALRLLQLDYHRYDNQQTLIDDTVEQLANQKIVGWFQGRMEWGPRALGNRSILAAATNMSMKDAINKKVKHRELFRPFAPAILDRYVKDYFHADRPLPECARSMLLVYPFTRKGKRDIPAAVHADGSGRLQAVVRQDNPLFYDLIESYRKKTGIPSIINTSFNVAGEPIVCTPRDAIRCFLATDIDVLVMGPYSVKK